MAPPWGYHRCMARPQHKSSSPRPTLVTPPAKAADDAQQPTRNLEIETKLEIDTEAALPEFCGRRSLAAVGLVLAAEPVVFELDAVYFDTADLDLLHAKLTLRRRTGGEDAGWHLKLPAVDGARTEVGLPLEPGDRESLTASVPAALADLVAGARRGKPLRPVARIRNRRTVRRLQDASGTPMVEVADDAVRATRLGSDGAADTSTDGVPESFPSSWRELEVEVLAGNRDQLAAVVALLLRAGAHPASSASKLGRALQDAKPATTRQPKTAGPCVVVALSRLRDTLIRTDRALREGTDRAVHDARAAARRLRSVLRVHEPLFAADSTRHLRDELRHVGAVLGSARDLQVLQGRLGRALDEEPSDYAAPAAERLNSEFSTIVPVAMAEVSALLRSDRYFALLRELDVFLLAPPFSRRAEKPAAGELSAQLQSEWKHLRRLVDRALVGQSDHVDGFRSPLFHEVRKRAKVVRYASEAAAATLGEDIVVFASAVEEVQEILGEHQDALTSAEWLAELALRPDTDGIAGFVFGRLHAFEQASAHGTLDDFADVWSRMTDQDVAGRAFDH